MGFEFQPKARLIFGEGAISRLGPLARELGFRRTLLVADRGLLDSGHVDEASTFLEQAAIEVIHATPPDRRSQIEDAKKSGEFEKMIGFMQMMSPTQAKVLGGLLDGDKAQVDFQGMLDGKAQKGSAELMHVGGTWYVGDVNLDAQ